MNWFGRGTRLGAVGPSPNAWHLLLICLFAFSAMTNLGCKERSSGDPDEKTPGNSATEQATAGKEGSRAHEVKVSPEAIQRYGVKIEPATKRVLVPTFSAPARVSFNTEAMAHVGSAVPGRVTELKVRVGDVVKQGDDLLIFQSPELGEAQSDYLQKRSAAAVAVTAVEPAKSAYERGKSLYDQSQGIALGEVQKREAEFKAAQGALQTAQSAALAADNKLRLLGLSDNAIEDLAGSGKINARHAVVAPIAGQVVEREVTLGELVTPDRQSLLTVADMTTLWVLADVPEARLNDFAVGSKAFLKVAAISQDTLEGKVSFISPALDPTTRSAQVRIEVPNGHATLRPGMFAQAEIAAAPIAGKTPEAVLAVPEPAVMTVEGGPAVFVPVDGEAGTFARRAIAVGSTVGGMVPVFSGLKEGEPVVVAGTFILKAELGKGAAEHDAD